MSRSPSRERSDGSFPSISSSSSVTSSYSLSSNYRHHHSPFVPTLTKPEKVLLHDAQHQPKTRGSLGIMVVGLRGKAGATLTAGLVANQTSCEWRGPQGQLKKANFQTCLTQTQFQDGSLADAKLAAIGGWDVESGKLGDALLEAELLDYDLVRQIQDDVNRVKVYRGFGIGDHVLDDRDGSCTSDVLKCLRADIRYFKWRNGIVGHTTIVWVANNESHSSNFLDLEDARLLLTAMDEDREDLPQSILYATAALLEGCSFVSGTPCIATQCPGLHDLARQQVGVYFLGPEFRSTQTEIAAVHYLETLGYQVMKPQQSDQLTTTVSSGFLSQPHNIITLTQQSSDAVTIAPCMLDAAVWCDFFSSTSWPSEKVASAVSYLFSASTGTYYEQLQTLKSEFASALESKGIQKSAKKKRVRIRPEEKTTEWAIPHDASIICAGLACVDMQLNQATGGDGSENIETFEGEKSIGGGSVSMACKTLARLCHGAPLDDQDFMQVSPPVVHTVVPLCKIGNDDSGKKLISLLESCGEACRNVNTKISKEARRRDADARTALAVLPIYTDGRRGCFFDAASNATFSAEDLVKMIHGLTSGSSGPELDVSTLTDDELDEYHDRVEGATPIYGAFLFGYPHLLPELQGQALVEVIFESRETMLEGGIVALDLNGVTEMNFQRNGTFRDVNDLRKDPVIGAALEIVDILHMNEDELCLLTGCELRNTPDSKLDDDFTIATAINLFLLCGVAIVAVTRGKKGSFVSCNDEKRFEQSPMLPMSWVDCTAKIKALDLPPGTAINTNGAGDSFTAGLLLAAMLRHTGMTIPDERNKSFDSASQGLTSPASATMSPSPKKSLTPYQFFMKENYVMIKQQCKDDKKAIFTKCHEMWENESDEVKAMYERRARDEAESPDKSEISMRFANDLNVIDASTPKAGRPTDWSLQEEKNQYMTNRALNLDSAVQFANLVAAHHVDMSTRDLTHIDITRLLERSLIFPEGLEEI